MKRFHLFTPALIVLLAVLSLLLGSSIGAAPTNTSYLPTVRTAVTQPTLITLRACSCGFASATVLPDGRVLVIWQDHDQGSRIKAAIDDNVAFTDVPDPMALLASLGMPDAAPGSGFTFPTPKQGPAGVVIAFGAWNVYAPARDVGDEHGKFALKRYQAPLLGLP